jgi:GT2 family glycosyltransferase
MIYQHALTNTRNHDCVQALHANQKNPLDRQEAPLVTVVIVNFNGGKMICQCLAALQVQSFRKFVVVVVDNNSTDDSVSFIQRDFPEVAVLPLDVNLGFAGGVNHALRVCNLGSWVALLNPDAFPAVDWLKNLLSSALDHPEYAAFGSRMYSDDDHQLLDGIGDAYHVSGLPWRRGHGCPNSSQYDQEREIFAPCAAAALYCVEALRAVGLLDQDLFLYVEDIDLGFRLRLAGYRSMYVPNAGIQHLGSAFVGKHSDLQIYYGHRNLIWVYVKNMPGILFWLFLPCHIALNLATLFWFTLRGHAPVIFRAKRDACRGIPFFWKKRNKIQSDRKVSIWRIFLQLSWNPFTRCA